MLSVAVVDFRLPTARKTKKMRARKVKMDVKVDGQFWLRGGSVREMILGFLLVVSAGCTTILSTSMTAIEAGNKNIVEVEASDFGYLHLTTPEINLLLALRRECSNGTINGVQTTLTLREFLVAQKYTLRATAYCK